jgi:hypothetical protein
MSPFLLCGSDRNRNSHLFIEFAIVQNAAPAKASEKFTLKISSEFFLEFENASESTPIYKELIKAMNKKNKSSSRETCC